MSRRRFRIVAGLAVAVLAAVTGLAWYASPALVRWALVWRVEAATGRALAVERVELDLLRGRLALGGLRLADRIPGPPLVELDRLEVRFRPRALLRGFLHVDDAVVVGPRLRVTRLADGALNVADLLVAPPPRARPAAVTIERFALREGAITFEDQALVPARTWRAEAIALDAHAVSTVEPERRGAARLTATVAGAPLAVDVSDLRAFPLHAAARVTLDGVDVTAAQIYLPASAALVLERARATVALAATVDARDGVRVEGDARIADVVLRRRGEPAPLLTTAALDIRLRGSESTAAAARLDRIEVTGALTVPGVGAAGAPDFRVDPLRLVVEGLQASGPAPAPVHLIAGLPGGAELRADGTLRPAARAAALVVGLRRLGLGFWSERLGLPLTLDGIAEADLVLDVAARNGLAARVRGRLGVDRAAVVEGRRRALRAQRIDVTGLDLAGLGGPAPRLAVERVRLARPGATVRRDADGRLSLLTLLTGAAPAAAPGPGPAAAPPGPAVAVEIGEVLVEDGRLVLIDEAVRPTVRLRATGVRFAASGLTWPARRPATVRLAAEAPQGGTLEVDGAVSLDPLRFDLRARIGGVPLAPYAPYVPMPARVAGRLDADLSVAGVVRAPVELRLGGAATLTDLAFAEADRPLLTVERLDTTGLAYTWPATLAVQRVRLHRPWAAVERRADGSFPLRALFTPVRPAPGGDEAGAAAAGPAPEAPVDVTVGEGVVEEAAATIVDEIVQPAARFDVAGVRLTARDFTWPPRRAATVRLRVPTPGGGRLGVQGEVALASPGRLDLRVRLRDVDLGPARPYLPIRGRVAAKASGDLQVQVALDPLAITARGAASLADAAVGDGTRPLLTVARIDGTGIDYAWPGRVVVDELRVRSPWAMIERAADGGLPLRDLFTPPPGARAPAAGPAPPSPSSAPPPPSPVDVQVRRAVLEDGGVTIVDGGVRPPARFEVRGSALTVQRFAWPARDPVRVRLATPMPGGGTLEARGRLRLDTASLDLRVALAGADLAPARPYVLARGRLAGRADAELRVRGRLAPLAVAVAGRLDVRDAALGDGDRTLVSVKHVDVTGVDVDWPQRVTIGRVGLRQPWSLVERDGEGGLPLLALLTPAQGAAEGPRAPSPAAARQGPGPARPRVEVGAVVVEDGFVRFVDLGTRPRLAEEVSGIGLTAQGLGTAPAAPARLSVDARLGGAPLALRGAVGPLDGPLGFDLEAVLTDFALPRVNPYADRFVGWVARRGALTAKVHYRARDDRLEATNEIVLAQPEFAPSRRGDEVRERLGVPLGMLVSLLKDARGEIRLSVPVTGVLSTRKFDFGEAVWSGVRRAVGSVLALPVSWIADLVVPDEDRPETVRLRPVTFEPGTAQPRRGLDRHAERLAQLLRAAPGVVLRLKPVVTGDDTLVLKRELVQRRIETLATPSRPVAAVAAQLFAARFPDRPPPAERAAIVAALAADEALPEGTVEALAAARVAHTRRELQALGGIGAARLVPSEEAVPVELAGRGRVEFEIAR